MLKFIGFIKDESGATAIEYALIAALISIAAILAMRNTGEQVGGTFDDVATTLTDARS